MIDFQDQYVLITGAAHGMGAAWSRQLASRGAKLILVDIDRDKLQQTFDSLGDTRRHRQMHVDMSDHASRQGMYQSLADDGVALFGLINNVGIGYWSNLSQTDWSRLERVMDVNVKGTTHLVHLFLPGMLERQKGVIVNLASTGAYCGANKAAVYTGTKAYIHNFTEALDMELWDTPIRVMAAYPGATATHFWEDAGTANSEMYRKLKQMTPDEAVGEFIRALDRGKKRWIAGFKNRMMVRIASWIPREMLKAMAIRKYA